METASPGGPPAAEAPVNEMLLVGAGSHPSGSPSRELSGPEASAILGLILAALRLHGEWDRAIYGSGVEMGSGSGPIKKAEVH